MKTYETIYNALTEAIENKTISLLAAGSEFTESVWGNPNDEIPSFGMGGDRNSDFINEIIGLKKGESVSDKDSGCTIENFRGVLLAPRFTENYLNPQWVENNKRFLESIKSKK